MMPPALPEQFVHLHLHTEYSTLDGACRIDDVVKKAAKLGMPAVARTDHGDLFALGDGLIVLSGCLNSEVNESIRAGQLDHARHIVQKFHQRWGEDYYLEIHDHVSGEVAEMQRTCSAHLLEWADEFGIKPVAANDVHFLNRDDHEAHDVLICIGTGKMVHDEKRMHYSDEVYFKTPKEMIKLFRHVPQALWSTLEIAEKCDLKIKLDSSSSEKYPQFESPDGSPRGDYFRRLCREGLKRRYGARADTPELQDRLNYEMD